MAKLLVISNHSVTSWSNDQKRGWDEIIFHPFPNVSPKASVKEVFDMADDLIKKIADFIRENPDGKVCLQGEFSLCFVVFKSIDEPIFVFPTTERVVEEKVIDGKTVKNSVFRFVQWRDMGKLM